MLPTSGPMTWSRCRRRTTSRAGGSSSTAAAHRVVVNLAAGEQGVPVGEGGWRVLLAWDGCTMTEGEAVLAGQSVAVLGPQS